jgi:cell division protein FtsN
MFIGLVLGVTLAAGVVWYLNSSALPFNKQVLATNGRSAAPAPGGQEPLPLPGKPGDPVPEKRFQFYDILPGKADAVPDPASRPEPPAKPEKKADKKDDAKDSKVPLFLQVGSFSTAQDADNQKAKLAFLGIEAVVQQVMVQERTLYRVRVGPYTKIDELNKIRAELAKSGIDAQLAK